ncbi:uncharacterized protein V6R79_017752 [Siganus canaliculatus]
MAANMAAMLAAMLAVLERGPLIFRLTRSQQNKLYLQKLFSVFFWHRAKNINNRPRNTEISTKCVTAARRHRKSSPSTRVQQLHTRLHGAPWRRLETGLHSTPGVATAAECLLSLHDVTQCSTNGLSPLSHHPRSDVITPVASGWSGEIS